MAFGLNDDSVDLTPTVKNTFISIDFMPREQRRKSVPPSARLCSSSPHSLDDGKFFVDSAHSDVSTYETEASTSGTRTPTSFDDPSYTSPQEVCVYPQLTPTFAELPPPPQPHTSLRRLNSKATAFQPRLNVQPVDDPKKEMKDYYWRHISEVIRVARVAIKHSEHVKSVEVKEDENGTWTIVIQPTGNEENQFESEQLMTLAKEALLDATASSKCIYVMGYCSPRPFSMRAMGFEATLGAMQSATSACWHVFKKGFCRHAEDCCKQHPACEIPVNVLIEGVQLNSCSRFAGVFKEQVADLALTVTASLSESPHIELVQAFQGKDGQGWTIEMTGKGGDDQDVHKEYLLTLAKTALFDATSNSEMVYIMGYATKPFTWKSRGFVSILGDMQDESRVCWDLYSKGACSRDCACRWEHPECLMPINVVVKEGLELSISR